jgi:hypothetical protein
MKFTVKDASGEVMSIVDAGNLIEAVAMKHRVQRSYNDLHGCDEVFTVAKATPKEVRKLEVAGFMVMPRKETAH